MYDIKIHVSSIMKPHNTKYMICVNKKLDSYSIQFILEHSDKLYNVYKCVIKKRSALIIASDKKMIRNKNPQ